MYNGFRAFYGRRICKPFRGGARNKSKRADNVCRADYFGLISVDRRGDFRFLAGGLRHFFRRTFVLQYGGAFKSYEGKRRLGDGFHDRLFRFSYGAAGYRFYSSGVGAEVFFCAGGVGGVDDYFYCPALKA